LDHKNGDRSNNKPSNCQVLCVPCHRRKHTK
jgi:5-methylcytosine-specific restriction endonuclease McrA